jgi:short subunit dehydrogenase-like uncharacterized protein
MSAPADNIASDDPVENTTTVAAESDTDMDEYLRQFDKVGESNAALANILKLMAKAQHDQERIQILTQYCVHLQRQNEQLFDLLVQMNNVLGQPK